MHDRESFQEQAREREWRVTQGWPVGSAKIERWRRFYTCPLFLSRGTS